MREIPDPFTLEALPDLVLDAGYGVLATASPGGAPEAALIGLVPTSSGEIVFDTPNATSKLRNVSGEPRVALVIGTGPTAVQIEGRARVVEGDERLGYERVLLTRFPASRVQSPGWSVVVVTPEWARCFDTRVHPPRITPALDNCPRPSDQLPIPVSFF